MNKPDIVYDVMVIGAGVAGMASALFAAQRGLSVAQTGTTGSLDFSTGFIDLMGVHPIEEGKRWSDPWKAIEAVVRDYPNHPYGLLDAGEIAQSVDGFVDFLSSQGLEYVGHDGCNTRNMTPAGTIKRTYRVPRSMWKGAEALESKASTLIVDFKNLKGFSGSQLVETCRSHWPGLRTVCVDFPGISGELYPEHMAWTLAKSANREKLAEAIRPHLADVEYIGFPAMLGLYDPLLVLRQMEELLGRQVFEIPTMPPSISGSRLRAAFDRGLPELGVRTFSQKKVLSARSIDDGLLEFTVGNGAASATVRAKAAILATGRFFGKGLKAERTGIKESLFDIPVMQPENREQWHEQQFFDAKGHQVNMAGVEVDARMRPLDRNGAVVHDTLHAAGAILAHHDWMRMKCGAGIAIATAFKAVAALQQ